MVSKHITRDFSAHRKSVIRPYDEFVGLEIFSFDPLFTQTYISETNNLTTSNATKTSWKSWNCYKSTDEQEDMKIELDYNVTEYGEYRIDFLYEKSNHISKTKSKNTGTNLVGDIKIESPDTVIREEDVRFDGENNILKRKCFFNQLNTDKHHITISAPHNVFFMGVIVRKLIKYTANNYYGADSGKDSGNLMLRSATVTISDMTKPSELQCEIGYDDALECFDSPSGFYIDYRDEVNFYVKDNDKQIERVFGGYVSSILPNDDRTKLTLHCADRLVDGQNKYILDQIALQGGTVKQSEDDYTDYMTMNFNSYGQALKYLCNCHEITLNNNISKNYLVDGEKYAEGLTITYGKNKDITSIKASNGYTKSYNNFIEIRNKPSSQKKQTWTLYDASKVAKSPILLNDKPYMHITYGMGSPKTELKSKTTEKVDTSDTSVGSQKFNKCGQSADKKYVMFIGIASVNETYKKYKNQYMKRIYKNKCPYCGKAELRFDDGHSNNCINRNGHSGNKHDVPEGEITCNNCDMDFDGVGGKEKITGSKKRLTPVTSPVKSSKAEQKKLVSGKLMAVPTNDVEVTSDDVFKAITKLAFKYKYKRGSSSSYTQMRKSGSGDCWAFSDLIFRELKRYGVSCKIVQYKTGSSDTHRSVLYKNRNNKWADFPYREYGWDTKYKNALNNTSGSKTGSKVEEFKGTNIGTVKVSTSNTKSQTTEVTTTKNYDKDKPFQGYLKITYSSIDDTVEERNKVSFDMPKQNLYIKFTYNANEKNALNDINFPTYWINNTVKKTTLERDGKSFSIVDYIRNGSNKLVYLHSIQMIAPVVPQTTDNKDTDWYKYDKSTIDESSCKMRLYQIVFNDNNRDPNSHELQSCGKTVNEMIKTLTDESGYLVDMDYGLHRSDDRINFRVDNSSNISYTATEGDNNNILSWNSISYSPISSMYNMTVEVFKTGNNQYMYVTSRYPHSVLGYGEQTTLQTINEPTSKEEAYFLARMNEKFNPVQTYSYAITVPNYPDIRLGDLVKVVANARKLSTVKTLKSIKISFDMSKIPRIQTELGLDELAPDLQLRENIRSLRQSAKQDTTSFSGGAIPVTDDNIYVWDR